MLEEITPFQWMEWKAFGKLRPFGDHRADLRNALLALAIDVVVAHVAGSDPCLDPEALMPFVPKSDESDNKRSEVGWEDPELTFAKLANLSAMWNADQHQVSQRR